MSTLPGYFEMGSVKRPRLVSAEACATARRAGTHGSGRGAWFCSGSPAAAGGTREGASRPVRGGGDFLVLLFKHKEMTPHADEEKKIYKTMSFHLRYKHAGPGGSPGFWGQRTGGGLSF